MTAIVRAAMAAIGIVPRRLAPTVPHALPTCATTAIWIRGTAATSSASTKYAATGCYSSPTASSVTTGREIATCCPMLVAATVSRPVAAI